MIEAHLNLGILMIEGWSKKYRGGLMGNIYDFWRISLLYCVIDRLYGDLFKAHSINIR